MLKTLCVSRPHARNGEYFAYGMNRILNSGIREEGTMGKKSKAQKKRLAKLERQNRRVPTWVMMKTDMEVSRNAKRRNWRRSDTDE